MDGIQLNRAYAEQYAKDHGLVEKYEIDPLLKLTERQRDLLNGALNHSSKHVGRGVDMSIDKTLDERGARYGKFKDHATISQALKDVMQMTDGWSRLSPDQAEALEMIQHKVARILNGDPNYHDSWHDIGGYSKLVADRLIGIEK